MTKKLRLNDQDREQWVQAIEGLFQSWKESGLTLNTFIKFNRPTIDKIATNMVTVVNPAESKHDQGN